MSPVAAPADKRFRRAHVKPARRRHNWRAWAKPAFGYLALAVVVSYGVIRGSEVVSHARALQIDRIVVHGNERLSSDEVLAVLDGMRGENLVWTDLDGWRQRLLASPWVRDAALRRSLPSTVEVAVRERRPMGIARIKGHMYLVDDHGVTIDEYGSQYADLDLPIVDGLSGAGAPDDETRAELAGRVIAAVKTKPDIARRLSQIDVSDAHNARVILSGDRALIELGEDQMLQRLQSYIELAPTLREQVPEIDYVDLRFDDRIYVRPTGKATRTPATTVPPHSGAGAAGGHATKKHGKR